MAQSSERIVWVGLILLLIAIGGIAYLLVINQNLNRQVEELQAQVTTLKSELEEQVATVKGQVTAVEEQVASIEERVVAVESLIKPLEELKTFLNEQFPEASPWTDETP